MVVVGADVHKRTHTFVAVDEVGRKLGEKVVSATTAGHQDAVCWARERFGVEVVWAIEDCRHLSARLERDLMDGLCFVTSLIAALISLRCELRAFWSFHSGLSFHSDLPIASHDEVSRELKLLVDRREVLVAQRTATINRLLWRVHELDPSRAPKPPFRKRKPTI